MLSRKSRVLTFVLIIQGEPDTMVLPEESDRERASGRRNSGPEPRLCGNVEVPMLGRAPSFSQPLIKQHTFAGHMLGTQISVEHRDSYNYEDADPALQLLMT